MYDDPVVTAERILTLFKDEPWAEKELAALVPLLIERINNEYDRGYDDGWDKVPR